MMKNTFTLLLIFAIYIVSAQKKHETLFDNGGVKEIGQCDKNNKPSGEWKRYYETGELKEVFEFEEGNLVGEWKFYKESGKLSNIIYLNTGLTENFDDLGKLFSSGKQIINKGKQGEWKEYYSNGNLKRVENYLDDIKNGPYKSYEIDGILYAEGQYKDNKEEGLWKYYYKDDVLKEIGIRKNGHRDGDWKEYHINGKLMWLRKYDAGNKTGSWEFYDSLGKLIRKENYN